MKRISLFPESKGPTRVLALGAHSDDIEIGCGGTLLRLVAERPDLEVLWVVFCATGEREREARASADAFLAGAARARVVVKGFRDGFLPYVGAAVKEEFEALKHEFEPDVVFTHYGQDRHQDHRLVSELSWNTFRHHLIVEYEIPKYDGDLGAPNFFSALPEPALARKVELILKHFQSQANKHWLTADLLRALARIRGVECVAESGFAEGFYCRKAAF
jgi:LmbE family N-acetylglucosaminyl deacetylase